MIPAWLVLAAGTALPPMPPDAPDKTEIVISGVGDVVAIRCAKNAAVMGKHLKTTQLKVVVTRSPRWGTIWRQDVAFPVDHPGDRPIIFRTVCCKDIENIRPLEMFDPKASIGPLK
jgi:hypothetical protein